MNQRQAKGYVLRVLAAEARHHIGNGSDWLGRPLRSDGLQVQEDEIFSEADYQRVVRAIETVADELERRAQRLGGGLP